MCLHFDTRDQFNAGLAAVSATTALAMAVAAARSKETAQYERIQEVIADMVDWSSVSGSPAKAKHYARKLMAV